MLAEVYAAVARRRREWFAARPHLRRRLRRPVISIGNIAAGGRGKTPFTACVARILLELGERPAILSRGYGRTQTVDGAVVVRDADGIRADLARAGDEPLMLARQLPGAIVVTSPDRYIGGRLAEIHLGATVHLLDDGFQHFQLDRDADIVLVSAADLESSTLPTGPLREPADVLVAADAIVALDDFASPVGDAAIFRAARSSGAPAGTAHSRVFAVAGIAHPQHFFDGLESYGWAVVGTRRFRDHHPYSSRDLDALFAVARAAGAEVVVTTEKDYVRLLPHRPFAMPVMYVPLTMEVERRDDFRRWLVEALAAARDIPLG